MKETIETMTAAGTPDKGNGLGATFAERVERGYHLGERRFPRDRLVRTVSPIAFSLERLSDAIGVVGDLNRRLSSRAESAAIDRMVLAPLELFRCQDLHDPGLSIANGVGLRVHDAHRQSARRWTQRAHARFPDRLSGNNVFVRQEPDQLVVWITTAGERSRGAGNRRQLDE